MKINIHGYKLIDIFFHQDERGNFQKIFNDDLFISQGVNFKIKESYISKSKKNSLRGMHYQKEPFDHDKLVACINGKALDVCIDIREDSETFGKIDFINLEPGSKAVFIPKGVAHGFFALDNDTIMAYYTTSVYNPKFDTGIHWNSIGFDWPNTAPFVSDRDSNHPSFKEVFLDD